MRCCLESLDDLYPDGPAQLATEGQLLDCKYCRNRMIFLGGSWQWNRDHG